MSRNNEYKQEIKTLSRLMPYKHWKIDALNPPTKSQSVIGTNAHNFILSLIYTWNNHTLYHVKGLFLGKLGCESHCEVLPLGRPKSSPSSPICQNKGEIIALMRTKETKKKLKL